MNDLPIDRRNLLLGMGAAAIATAAAPLPALADPAATSMGKRFPRGFRWGASTAGHQIEGNDTNSDLWLIENIKPTGSIARAGDACDSYNRFREDIALLAGLGLNSYRFSVEWSRIEPDRGYFSNAELDHYRAMLAACHQHDVSPVVTFIHSAAPRWFAEAGGWLNPEASDLFAHYCDKVARELGDGMAYACTINEPQVGITYRTFAGGGGYFKDKDAVELRSHAEAARRTGSERFITTNYPDQQGMQAQLLAGHEKAYAAIKAAQPKLPTGVTLNLVDFHAANADSPIAALRTAAYGPWMDCVKRAGDFVGVQTYRQIPIPGPGAANPPLPDMPFVDRKDMGELVKQPSALRSMVEYAHQATGKPVFVTENGLETDNDARRAWYIPQVLGELHKAIADGVPVIGYCHWSLLDNFEWERGYEPHFGLFAVDRTTFQRTKKPSADVLGRIARANAV